MKNALVASGAEEHSMVERKPRLLWKDPLDDIESSS